MNAFDAHLKNINIPTAQSKIYKDECAYTFHTTVSNNSYIIILFIKIANYWPIVIVTSFKFTVEKFSKIERSCFSN